MNTTSMTSTHWDCCDFCEDYAELAPFKDPEEGAAGATYDICGTCRISASRIPHDSEDD